MPGAVTRRIAANAYMLGRALLSPTGCLRPKCFVALGVFYQMLPVDLIPNGIFLVGYLDNAAVAVAGSALAWLSIPRRYVDAFDAATRADHDHARDLLRRAGRRSGHGLRTVRWRARMGLVTALGSLLCRPILRLVLRRASRRPERIAFRAGLRQGHVALPPLMRALAALPEARPALTRTMLASWMLADPSYQGALRQGLDSRDSEFAADRLRIWTSRPISFLHLEKTAGTSLLAALSGQFHPGQIDPDPWRAMPPHLLSPFTANARERIRYRPLVWGHYDLPSLRRLDPDRFVLTMLRQPADRLLSLYHHWRSVDPAFLGGPDDNPQVRAAHRLGLLEFLRSADPLIVNFIDNLYVRRLLGLYAQGDRDPLHEQGDVVERALVALHGLDFVGVTEAAGRSATRLGVLLGAEGLQDLPQLNVAGTADRAPEFRPVLREPVTPQVEAELSRLTVLDDRIYEEALAMFEGRLLH